jgi:3-oxoacyl-[acyl-carrier-protein] synthase II
MGVVSPNGLGVHAFASNCREGLSGLQFLREEMRRGIKSTIAGISTDFDPTTVLDPAELRRVPRMIPMALGASREALAMAKISINEIDLDLQRSIGVALGTGGGGLAFVEQQYEQLFTRGQPSLYSITAGTHGNLSSELSIHLHLRGPSHVISTGCTSSTDAIGYARMLVQNEVVPMMLAGGADSPIATGILGAFEKMKVVSVRRWDNPAHASRPFSKDRDGFILGEGAWMFVLEDLDHAIARDAAILAEIAGYGSTCDAYHRVQIAPDIVEPVRAMQIALRDADLQTADIDYINLHGTSTQMNDSMETLAVKKCFERHAYEIPMSSTKSMIGHPQGACGAAGVAATICMMRDQFIHPTINLVEPDETCDLNYVPLRGCAAKIDAAMCNCIAFGSKNSALILRRFA